ncbi:MAG: hypothetical protein AAF618_01560 [Pseudomonadota bacterium]
MDKRDKDLSEAELARLFEAADAEAPLPSAALFARILADAEEVRAPIPASVPGFFSGLRDALGGWAGLSGLAGAVATGLVIGIFTPEALASYAEGLFGSAALFSDYVPDLAAVSFDG